MGASRKLMLASEYVAGRLKETCDVHTDSEAFREAYKIISILPIPEARRARFFRSIAGAVWVFVAILTLANGILVLEGNDSLLMWSAIGILILLVALYPLFKRDTTVLEFSDGEFLKQTRDSRSREVLQEIINIRDEILGGDLTLVAVDGRGHEQKFDCRILATKNGLNLITPGGDKTLVKLGPFTLLGKRLHVVSGGMHNANSDEKASKPTVPAGQGIVNFLYNSEDDELFAKAIKLAIGTNDALRHWFVALEMLRDKRKGLPKGRRLSAKDDDLFFKEVEKTIGRPNSAATLGRMISKGGYDTVERHLRSIAKMLPFDIN